MRRRFAGLLRLLYSCFALGIATGAVAQPAEDTYPVRFTATVVPTEREARVEIRVGPGDQELPAVKRIVFRFDPERHEDPEGDGQIVREGNEVYWEPPARGGSFRYRFSIDSLRGESGYDARCAETFAIFRGGDLFPPARVRARKGARSRSTLRLKVPEGWSVAVPYRRAEDGTHVVAHAHRRFDRPTGWMAVGRLGILRERVSGTSVAIAAPAGQGVRRQDLLAMLRWTLPELRDVLGDPMPRLLVVGAGDPMWRGGLSAPRSTFVHASRPLISRDGTSPLLHEVFHAATGARSGENGDWIVEGLAELYSLELMVRSRTISKRRFERALARLEERGAGAKLSGADSSGDSTARAVGVLRGFDARIRKESGDAHSLDDVVAELARRRSAVTPALLREAALERTGVDLAAPLAALGF
ncbi:MAG: hypothetical protein QNK05_22405 [Myxococcota bacterium]|nr:hypothetical protein [Myxococcota bacterium]